MFWKPFLLKPLVSSARSLGKRLEKGGKEGEGTLKFLWSYYCQPCYFGPVFGFCD